MISSAFISGEIAVLVFTAVYCSANVIPIEDKAANNWLIEYDGKQISEKMETLDSLRNQPTGPALIKGGGYWVPARVPVAFPFILNMEFREQDVVACAFPKSGTNWVHYILHLVMTECDERTIQGHHPRLLEVLPLSSKKAFSEFINDKSPRLAITHLPAQLLPVNIFNARVVYIYRDAKDVAVSLYHHYLSLAALPQQYKYSKTFDEFVRDFMRGEVVYGPHYKHVQSFLNVTKSGQQNLLLVSYEKLMYDKAGEIQRIANFLGKKLTTDQIDRIIDLTSPDKMRTNSAVNWSEKKAIGHYKKDTDFIRKAIVGDWHSHFTDKELLVEFESYVEQNYPLELFPNDDNESITPEHS